MPRKVLKTWVLVADGARARILRSLGAGQGLATVEEFTAPEGRALAQDLGSDRPGRTQMASGNRHAVEPRSDPRDLVEEAFLRQVAHRLEEANRDRSFDRLVVVAPPRAMGLMRKALSSQVQARVAGEMTKDLTRIPDHALPEHLREMVRC